MKNSFRLLAVALGALHAWNARQAISPDGISYLDMSDAYLRGDWEMAINGLWSPLYSWLLGLGKLIFRPSPYEEVAVAHLINFVVYLCTLGCFEFLLRELVRSGDVAAGETDERRRASLPVWAWMALGYPLFIWASLGLITVAAVTPDMCVAALMFLAAGMLLRIRRGVGGWLTFVVFGAVLGLSYLAKSAMLPIDLLFLTVGLFSVGSIRRAVPRVLLALGVFLLVGAIYFVPLSVKKGRLTFSDSGVLNYAWYVNKVTLHVHWQGGDRSNGNPKHPTRKLRDAPAVYEFREPIRGTYPPWYDASYWYEGVNAHFDLENQIRVLRKNLGILSLILFSREQKIWWLGFLFLFLFGCRRWSHLWNVLKQWPLLLMAIAALSMFSMVHVEARYTGAFVVLLWLGLFSGVRLSEHHRWRQVAACVVVGLSLVMLKGLVSPTAAAARVAYREVVRGEEASPDAQRQVAEHLQRSGLRPGDEVASIGYAFDALWARLARVRIVSEITSGSLEAPAPDAEQFWRVEAPTQAEILELFARLGAKAVVANRVPPGASTSGWHRVGSTDYYVYLLAEGMPR